MMVEYASKISPNKKVDRLPIIATQAGVERILRVPKLARGTGMGIAGAVYETLKEYGLDHIVEAVSFDTENANIGIRGGAAHY